MNANVCMCVCECVFRSKVEIQWNTFTHTHTHTLNVFWGYKNNLAHRLHRENERKKHHGGANVKKQQTQHTNRYGPHAARNIHRMNERLKNKKKWMQVQLERAASLREFCAAVFVYGIHTVDTETDREKKRKKEKKTSRERESTKGDN